MIIFHCLISNHRDDFNKCNYFLLLYVLLSLQIPSVTSWISARNPADIRQISGAAMNLNRPYCETTKQMTFWRTSNHRRGILLVLRKSKFCSHLYLFKKSANIVRCSHFFQHLQTNNLYLFVFTLFCSQFRGQMETLL